MMKDVITGNIFN